MDPSSLSRYGSAFFIRAPQHSGVGFPAGMNCCLPHAHAYVSAFAIALPQHEGIASPALTSLLPHSAPMWQMYIAFDGFADVPPDPALESEPAHPTHPTAA